MLTEAEFRKLQQGIMTSWHRGDLGAVSAAVDKVLVEGTAEMKGECLFYQGMICEDRDALADAKQNWLAALKYARAGTFLRFQVELNIGKLWEREEQSTEALDWFGKALKTCCEGDDFAGTSALSAYLNLKEGKIEPEDESLIACVAEKSWRVLELPSAPDATDWPATAAKLEEALADRRAEIVNDSEG